MLNSTSILCRALLDTSLAAESCTPRISIYVWYKHLIWHMIGFDIGKDEFLFSNTVKEVYVYLTKFLHLHVFKGAQILLLNK